MRSRFTYRVDGEEIVLRTIMPSDRQLLNEGFHHLSVESRYTRFFSSKSSLTEDQITYLTNVDQNKHIAWGALDKQETRGIALGRFIRMEESPDVAEIAITVADSYHHKGLGTVMFSLLYVLAQDLSVKFFRSYVLPNNYFVTEKMRSLDGKTEFTDGVYVINIPVYQNLDELPSNRYTNSIRELIADMKTCLHA